MMGLKHPAVVGVLDPGGEDDAFCYYAMELVPGGNLRDAVLGRRVDPGRRLPLILQVGEALAEAHRRGLVHRDVKPANILLDEDGNAKLADFDLVGAHDTTGGTRTGALGTVIYAAPECLHKPQEATARADVFGLGMTAIFCLSGQDLTMDTFRNPGPTVASLDCPVSVREIVERAVAWNPDERFADAADMMAALRDSLNVTAQRASSDDGEAARAAVVTAERNLRVEPSQLAGQSDTAGDGSPQSEYPEQADITSPYPQVRLARGAASNGASSGIAASSGTPAPDDARQAHKHAIPKPRRLLGSYFRNYSARETNVKIIYVGPHESGVSSNLNYIYERTAPDSKGRMSHHASAMFFDFKPASLQAIRGFSTRFHLYKMQCAPFEDASRKLLLKGVAGIVFVADSQRDRIEANLERLEEMRKWLSEERNSLDGVPLVFQYNKRDLPGIPVDELRAMLNPTGEPDVEAVASKGIGVFDTLKAIAKLIVVELRRE